MNPMRRSDRAMAEEKAWQVLDEGVYGILATTDEDGWPHGVPLNYVRVENKLFFHSAVAGKKLSNIQANPKVCFTVIGNHEVQPKQFTINFESVMVYGQAIEVSAVEDKVSALMHLVRKYSPGFEVSGEAYARAAVDKTRLFQIDIEHISGKERHS